MELIREDCIYARQSVDRKDTIRSNIIAGAIFKILSRSFYAEILALQGLQAGLRDSYFIRDKSGKEIRRRAAGSRA